MQNKSVYYIEGTIINNISTYYSVSFLDKSNFFETVEIIKTFLEKIIGEVSIYIPSYSEKTYHRNYVIAFTNKTSKFFIGAIPSTDKPLESTTLKNLLLEKESKLKQLQEEHGTITRLSVPIIENLQEINRLSSNQETREQVSLFDVVSFTDFNNKSSFIISSFQIYEENFERLCSSLEQEIKELNAGILWKEKCSAYEEKYSRIINTNQYGK